MRSNVYFHPQFRNELNQYKISLPRYLTNRFTEPPNKLLSSRDQLYEIITHLELDEIINLCKSDKQLSKACQDDQRIMNLIWTKQQQIKQKTDEFLVSLNDGYYHLDPITEALWREQLDIIDELIKRGYDPSVGDNRPIVIASKKGYLNIVKRLLRDPRVDPAGDDNMAIIEASRKGHLDIVNLSHRVL